MHEAYDADEKFPADSVTQVAPHSCALPRIPLTPKLKVSGVVVHAKGQPVPNVPLWLDGTSDGRRFIRGKADSEGRFLFTGIHPGSYHLLTAGEERKTYLNRQFRKGAATPLDVRIGSDTDDIRMVLLDSGARRRCVSSSPTQRGGRCRTPQWATAIQTVNTLRRTQTSADGSWVLQLFENAEYSLEVMGSPRWGPTGSVRTHLPAGRGDREIRIRLGAGYSIQ
ncbi:MAG: carboxypeptidase regulatory-like domain-containing protein [Bryobacterales bacterium]|nr:carboxypeptidase regulatory-like domain-containing protein [Bryobacterales bacterium]